MKNEIQEIIDLWQNFNNESNPVYKSFILADIKQRTERVTLIHNESLNTESPIANIKLQCEINANTSYKTLESRMKGCIGLLQKVKNQFKPDYRYLANPFDRNSAQKYLLEIQQITKEHLFITRDDSLFNRVERSLLSLANNKAFDFDL